MHYSKRSRPSDEQATDVLAEVIMHSPGYSGKWAAAAPAVTAESRQQLAERIKSSDRLRRVLSELGHDPDDMAAEVRRQIEKSTSKDEEGMR